MAVDKTFELPVHEVTAIECEVGKLTKVGLDLALEMHKGRRETGLKQDLRAAYVGGDRIEIQLQQKRAHEAARQGLYVTTARRAVTMGYYRGDR